MRDLSLDEVLDLHARILRQLRGSTGIRDLAALDSAVEQPRSAAGRSEVYRTTVDRAAALGVALIRKHPFVDGNKRLAHAAIEVTLLLNGYEIAAEADEQTQVMLEVGAGKLSRDDFAKWLRSHADFAMSQRVHQAIRRCFAPDAQQIAVDLLLSVRSDWLRAAILVLAYGDMTQLTKLVDLADDYRDVVMQFDNERSGLSELEIKRRWRELGLDPCVNLHDYSERIEEDVLRFVAYETIVPRNRIDGSTRLQDDFGLQGRDGLLFMSKFAEQFHIDVQQFRPEMHFTHEEPMAITTAFRRLFGCSSTSLRTITVQDLVDAALRGKLITSDDELAAQ